MCDDRCPQRVRPLARRRRPADDQLVGAEDEQLPSRCARAGRYPRDLEAEVAPRVRGPATGSARRETLATSTRQYPPYTQHRQHHRYGHHDQHVEVELLAGRRSRSWCRAGCAAQPTNQKQQVGGHCQYGPDADYPTEMVPLRRSCGSAAMATRWRGRPDGLSHQLAATSHPPARGSPNDLQKTDHVTDRLHWAALPVQVAQAARDDALPRVLTRPRGDEGELDDIVDVIGGAWSRAANVLGVGRDAVKRDVYPQVGDR